MGVSPAGLPVSACWAYDSGDLPCWDLVVENAPAEKRSDPGTPGARVRVLAPTGYGGAGTRGLITLSATILNRGWRVNSTTGLQGISTSILCDLTLRRWVSYGRRNVILRSPRVHIRPGHFAELRT